MANAVNIPVFASSLIQVPIVHKMLGSKQKIGIITADSNQLGEDHIRAAGIDESIPICIAGIQEGEEWQNRINKLEVNPQKLEKELSEVAKKLVLENPTIGAMVLECTNLPPFAFGIQRATGLPVFDIYTLTKMVYDSLFRKSFFRHSPLQFFDDNRFV